MSCPIILIYLLYVEDEDHLTNMIQSIAPFTGYYFDSVVPKKENNNDYLDKQLTR